MSNIHFIRFILLETNYYEWVLYIFIIIARI